MQFFTQLYPSDESHRGDVNDLVEPLMAWVRVHSGETAQSHVAPRGKLARSNAGSNAAAKEFLDSLFEMFVKRGLVHRAPGVVLDCTKSIHSEVRPFGSSGHRIYSVITGALSHLAAVRDMVSTTTHLAGQLTDWPLDQVSRSCQDGITRITGGCAACERTSPAHACHSTCVNVARGCLVERFGQLHRPLERFTGKMAATLKKVKGEPRFEDIQSQLTLDVRMALQNAQENAENIFNQVLYY